MRKFRYSCEDDPAIPPGCHDVEVFGYQMVQCYCDESDFCTGRFDAEDALLPDLVDLKLPNPKANLKTMPQVAAFSSSSDFGTLLHR